MFGFGGNNDDRLFASGGQIAALYSLSLEVLSIDVYSSLTLYCSVNYNTPPTEQNK